MKKFIKSVFFVFLLGLLVFGVYFYFFSKDTLKIKTANRVISYHIERAVTQEEQRTGLMGRSHLPPKNGMLFVFETPRVARMWMKNTLIPLDMIFFDSDGQIVYTYENAKPLNTTVISSYKPVAGVLEINAGEVKKFGIQKGSILNF